MGLTLKIQAVVEFANAVFEVTFFATRCDNKIITHCGLNNQGQLKHKGVAAVSLDHGSHPVARTAHKNQNTVFKITIRHWVEILNDGLFVDHAADTTHLCDWIEVHLAKAVAQAGSARCRNHSPHRLLKELLQAAQLNLDHAVAKGDFAKGPHHDDLKAILQCRIVVPRNRKLRVAPQAAQDIHPREQSAVVQRAQLQVVHTEARIHLQAGDVQALFAFVHRAIKGDILVCAGEAEDVGIAALDTQRICQGG